MQVPCSTNKALVYRINNGFIVDDEFFGIGFVVKK